MGDREWTAATLDRARRTGQLGPAPFLRDVPVNELEVLRDQMTPVKYSRDRVLQLAGSVPQRCWLLLEGYCKAVIPMPSGNEIISMLAGPGDLIGPLAPSPRTAAHSIVTMTPMTALTAASGDVRLAACVATGLMDGILRVLADREEQCTDRIVRAAAPDAAWRVRSALVDLANRWSTHTTFGTRITIPLSQGELGSWLCLSRESVAKVLHDLRNAGLVSTARRELVVHDVEALANGRSFPMSA